MITFENVTKAYRDVRAVHEVSFTVPSGTTCVLLGPSGCGKTTLMKMVNRLIPKTGGRILIDGRDVDQEDAVTLRRNIGYVIQQVGLFPNMTVEQNVRVVPDLLGWDRQRARDRVVELLDMLDLDSSFLDRYPNELSGGQAQRVGVARALAADPPVLLMDEPFGAVDPVSRAAIQVEFAGLQRRLKKTVIFVSHDLDEALKLGDLIAIMRGGHLVQCAAPAELLARPKDPFVREFIGGDRVLRQLRLLDVASAIDRASAGGIGPDEPAASAAETMRAQGRTSLPVLDGAGRPLGILRSKAAAAGGATVRDAMEELGPSVHPGDDLRSAASLMLALGSTELPCLDADGRLLGYLTPQGIARALGPYDGPARLEMAAE